MRIRSIHYDGFKSRKLAKASAEAERLFWRLMCACDDDGRAEDEPDILASVLFPVRRDIDATDINRWLTELAELQLIDRYVVKGVSYIAYRQWSRFQHPRRAGTSRIPAPQSRSKTR